MTSTSFESRSALPRHSTPTWPAGEEAQQDAVSLKKDRGSLETQRIKNFTGQQQFQPPAAGDFARGMLPHGLEPSVPTSGLQQLFQAIGAMACVVQRFLRGG